MTLVILVVIIALAACCTLLKWHRTSKTFYVLAALFFLVVGCGPAPRWLLGHLQSGYETRPRVVWGSRNAIVLLGAGRKKRPARHDLRHVRYPLPAAQLRCANPIPRSASSRSQIVGGPATSEGLGHIRRPGKRALPRRKTSCLYDAISATYSKRLALLSQQELRESFRRFADKLEAFMNCDGPDADRTGE